MVNINNNSVQTVLVAEDNLVNQKLLKLLLTKLGYLVNCVNDGLESVSEIRKQHYSIILMDIQMPIMDGFEATRNIRKIESGSGKYTPIIAVTANTEVGIRMRCFEAGMDDYLSKPIGFDLLKTKVEYFLSKTYAS
ncbi:response regulator [Heliobacterium chlorum]|uniref:Stage 0 sporulation protein A homolog n=1 Tax=Heliobacterium chlorum TaxID=2698 RepID=A0ABR7T6S6_HELCL|nr:response regulator [Heliobacterium chlorum]MBC9786469.1 response regulator [Heliobacterium chlorum]